MSFFVIIMQSILLLGFLQADILIQCLIFLRQLFRLSFARPCVLVLLVKIYFAYINSLDWMSCLWRLWVRRLNFYKLIIHYWIWVLHWNVLIFMSPTSLPLYSILMLEKITWIFNLQIAHDVHFIAHQILLLAFNLWSPYCLFLSWEV